MKKAYLYLCAALLLAACDPSTTTTTTGTDTTKVDSNAVVSTDSTPEVDTTPVDSSTSDATHNTGTDGGNTATTDKGGNSSTSTTGGGRTANPNGNLDAKTFKVTGHILVKGHYCGGAAPTQAILDEAERPRPMVNQGFLIRPGSTNLLGKPMVTRARTDAKGNFSIDLPAGTYCMVLEEKENARVRGFYDNTNYSVDRKCDDKWLGTCDLSFTVVDKPVSGLRHTFEKKCFIDNTLSPCISWNGPLPPSAPRGGGN